MEENLTIAQNYAEHIWEKYQELQKIEAYGFKDSSSDYKKNLKDLKLMVECERAFYHALTPKERGRLIACLERKPSIGEQTTLEDILYLEDEEMKNCRIRRNIRAAIQDSHCNIAPEEMRQIGLIALTPMIAGDRTSLYSSQIDLCDGCYNTQFTDTLLRNEMYAQPVKEEFKYKSAYCKEVAENYYLNSNFELQQNTLQALENIVDEHILDVQLYSEVCSQYFEYILQDLVDEYFEFGKADFESNELKTTASICRDAIYSYFKVVPIKTAIHYYSVLPYNWYNPWMQNYLDKKVIPMLEQRKVKAYILSYRK